jgi:streptogramin lyase
MAKILAGLTAFAAVGVLPAAAPATTVTEYPTPTVDSLPHDITAGPDGALWFTEVSSDRVGRITTGGAITEFTEPDAGPDQPTGITSGPDGNLWFTQLIADEIGRVTPAGTITEFPLPVNGAKFPEGIVAGPDNALWFTEALNDAIGRITTLGVVTNEFPLPDGDGLPNAIARGPDGALWFTEPGFDLADQIGRITTSGTITEFNLPANSSPQDIAAGPDGALWFTMPGRDRIGRITTGGTITEFPVPADMSPRGITAGPDGALYFTDVGVTIGKGGPNIGGGIGRITTAGVVSEFPIPTPSGEPESIVAGPDGALWFTERDASKIGRIDLTPPPTTILSAPTSVTTDTPPTFTFSSSEPGTTFECRLNGGPFLPCSSPITLQPLAVGAHTFEVRAIGWTGSADPTPAAAAFEVVLPPPVLGEKFNIEVVSGAVLIASASGPQLTRVGAAQKGRSFVPLTSPRQLTVGSFVDTKKGRARITTATDVAGSVQQGEFFKGLFQVLQSRSTARRGLATMRLKGSSYRRCRSSKRGKRRTKGAVGHAIAVAARKKLSKKTIRRLGANATGNYATRGTQSAATIRNTIWITADRCDGTLTKVRRGTVAVRDFRRKKTVLVKAGKRYLARRR